MRTLLKIKRFGWILGLLSMPLLNAQDNAKHNIIQPDTTTNQEAVRSVAASTSSAGSSGDRDITGAPLKSFLPAVVGPSPTAASLGIFGKVEVSNYTGIPNINVPFYELKSRDLNLPIGLNYHSGGTKVETISSWVGLGWSLAAGGAITREMHGLPDETPGKGYFTWGDKVNNFENLSQGEQIDLIVKSENYDADTEPDIFYFNFGGRAGKFIIDENQNIRVIPHQNLKIAKTISNGRIVRFDVTTEEGIRYIFGKDLSAVEETKASFLSVPIQYEWKYHIQPHDFSTPVKIDGTGCFSGGGGLVGGSPLALETDHYRRCEKIFGICPPGGEVPDDKLFLKESYDPKIHYASIEEKIPYDGYFTSTWHLSEIVSPGNGRIIFSYNDVGEISYVGAPSISHTIPHLMSSKDKIMFGYYSGPNHTPIPTTHPDEYFFYLNRTETNPGEIPEAEGYYDPCTYEFVSYVTGQRRGIRDALIINKEPETNDNPNGATAYGESIGTNQNKVKIKVKRLSRIDTERGDYVIFNVANDRSDLPGDVRLRSVVVYNYLGSTIKAFTLTQEYVSSNQLSSATDPLAVNEAYMFQHSNLNSSSIWGRDAIDNEGLITHDKLREYALEGLKHYNYKRMYLTSVQEHNGLETNLPYEFSYHIRGTLPRRTSVLSGKWGYTRGHSKPRTITNDHNQTLNIAYGFADVPNSESGDDPQTAGNPLYGLLAKITYPTGGTTVLESENNPHNAGARIRRMVNYQEDNGAVASITRYAYNSYKLFHEPVFETYRKIMVDPHNQRSSHEIIRTSFDQTSLSLTQGSLVGYPLVTVYTQGTDGSNLGMEKFEYLSYKDVGEIDNSESASKTYFVPSETFYVAGQAEQKSSVTTPIHPFAAKTGVDYRNGLLRVHHVYKRNDDNSYSKLQETINNYSNFKATPHFTRVKGLKGASYLYIPGSDDKKYRAGVYDLMSEWVYLESVENRVFDESDESRFLETLTHYTYDPLHLQAVGTKIVDPEGVETTTIVKYPTDYTLHGNTISCTQNYIDCQHGCEGLTGSQYLNCLNLCGVNYENCTTIDSHQSAEAIAIMRQRHMITPAIETTVWRKEGLFEKLLSSTLTEYKKVNPNGNTSTGIVKPHKIYTLQTNTTIPKTGDGFFQPSTISGNDEFHFDPRFELEATFTEYSSDYGNVLETTSRSGVDNAYIWGYKKSLPVAKSINSKSNEIAYTSFEAHSDSKWTYSNQQSGINGQHFVTGKKSLTYSTVSLSNLPVGEYTLSYWMKGGQAAFTLSGINEIASNGTSGLILNHGWQYFEHDLNVSSSANAIDIAVGAAEYLDELRIHPADAHMTTYTYEPLVGMTSTTGVNHTSTHYEYDRLQRLEIVRDHHKNIIKAYEYEQQVNTPMQVRINVGDPEIVLVALNEDPSTTLSAYAQVHGTAINGDLTYKWDTGSGFEEGQQFKTLTYSTPGTYQVKLQVSHPDYLTSEDDIQVRVIEEALSASLSCVGSCAIDLCSNTNETITLNASVSGGCGIVTFKWETKSSVNGAWSTVPGNFFGLTTGAIYGAQSYYVRCTATDSCGTEVTTNDYFINVFKSDPICNAQW